MQRYVRDSSACMNAQNEKILQQIDMWYA